MIYLALALFVGDIVLLWHLKRERERHAETKLALRWMSRGKHKCGHY